MPVGLCKDTDTLMTKNEKINELLEVCKEARNYLQFNKGNASPIFDKVNQAITKAEGKLKEGKMKHLVKIYLLGIISGLVVANFIVILFRIIVG
jgi:hypothetical protein